MASGNPQECLDIPAVIRAQDDLGTVHTCAGDLFYEAYKNLSPKVAKLSTVLPSGKDDAGTGFFVQDGTHMVTSAHVVLPAAEIHVNYQGKQYSAVVEKLDDVNDLAQLKVIGLGADPSRAQAVRDVTLRGQEPVLAVGIPGVHNQEQYVSPGNLVGSNKLFNILNDPNIQSPEVNKIRAAFNSGDPVLAQQAEQVANSPRLILSQGVRPGQSGSPITDLDGNLVGVVTAANANNASVDVPYTKVQDLLNRPESKFNFNYQIDTRFAMPSTQTLLADTVGLGATASGVLGRGRALPIAYAGMRAVSLVSEIKDLTNATDSQTKHDLEVNIGQDAAMVAGGVAATALWSNPYGRIAGVGLMGLSLASRFITDSQEKHYVLTGINRKNGDYHRPWGM
ncbi:MAG: trypsin-like peptidase domain-containing protein [Cyanobacteria bacterium SZAS LIN-2]|nr:trypsin-like peptidase domain-containing protein [Cyanobacteria bacterium SZAS LIN-2]